MMSVSPPHGFPFPPRLPAASTSTCLFEGLFLLPPEHTVLPRGKARSARVFMPLEADLTPRPLGAGACISKQPGVWITLSYNSVFHPGSQYFPAESSSSYTQWKRASWCKLPRLPYHPTDGFCEQLTNKLLTLKSLSRVSRRGWGAVGWEST